ncbi:glutathione S-transferase T1-like isoform X3 [Cornus florida]|uniref:glutathione S-transferase T1-like isoform X3 n=1 Tax=Cornus florida TaxID=4283 RepID=UPI0028A150CF|nr:glutathione S-transferase T1-like isoform X3 [Cornus florida]
MADSTLHTPKQASFKTHRERTMKLKVYVYRMSQPSRAILLFCKVNGIDFEEIKIDLFKRQHLTPEFAVMQYLSILLVHFLELQTIASFVLNMVLGPSLGLPTSPQAAAEAEKLLSASLAKIESFWLKGNGRFLLGSFQPSIADLSLVCEIMELEILDEKDFSRILGPHKKVQQWIEDTRNATRPHFDEIHSSLFKVKVRFQKQLSGGTNEPESSMKKGFHSKM